jgi:AraC-like DNA-binding protein
MPRVPFLTLSDRTVATSDSQAFAETVSLMLRLQDCDSLLPDQGFESVTGVVQLGRVSVLATSGSPVDAVAEAVEYSTFMLPYPGCDVGYRIEGKSYLNNHDDTILHIPPVGWKLQSQTPLLAGLSMLVPAPQLMSTATAMGAGSVPLASLSAALQTTAPLCTSDRRGGAILNGLYRFFGFVESVLQGQAMVPEILRLDDLLVRQLLLLMLPGLGEVVVPALPPSAQEPWFEQLLDWIDANCHRPLSLSELEERSCYSRRALQYAFKQRFGCGPMHWVRRRRLQQARQLLLEAAPGTTVQQVSLACGYINLSSFSRDYRQEFGRKASDDLRWRA